LNASFSPPGDILRRRDEASAPSSQPPEGRPSSNELGGCAEPFGTTRLKIAVVVDKPETLAPWITRLLDEIFGSPRLDLCGVIKSDKGSQASPASRLWRVWAGLESRIVRPRQVDCSAFEAIKHTLPVVDRQQEAAIQILGLDVILDLTEDCDASYPSHLSRHGIWSVQFQTGQAGITDSTRDPHRFPVNRISIFRKGPGSPDPVTIATGVLDTKLLATRNALFIREKSVSLIIRELNRLQMTGESREIPRLKVDAPALPKRGDFPRYLIDTLAQCAARGLDVARAALRLRPGMFFLATTSCDVRTFDPAQCREHIAPDNQFYADPFLWEQDGECYCFFEAYDYTAKKGRICVGLFDDGRLTDVRDAVTAPYHLSFPFLFEDGGTLYMMPETCGANRIETWRCVSFPDRWERHATVLDGVMAADSTFNLIDGKWWLFTNLSHDAFGEMNSELHIYQADGPDFYSLIPHPLNPVIFDSRTGRNGGRVLEIEGHYYRPSQDNSHGLYGYGLNLMRIDRLTSTDYSESLVRRIEPNFGKGINGCHHLDVRSGKIVIDVRRKVGGWPRRKSQPLADRHERWRAAQPGATPDRLLS